MFDIINVNLFEHRTSTRMYYHWGWLKGKPKRM